MTRLPPDRATALLRLSRYVSHAWRGGLLMLGTGLLLMGAGLLHTGH
jgi:hypothetical protein